MTLGPAWWSSYTTGMEIIFGFGLLGLLGAYFFLTGYARALDEMRDDSGTLGLLLGFVPVFQWLWALAHPRRGLPALGRQLVGAVMLAPSGVIVYFVVSFLSGNIRIG